MTPEIVELMPQGFENELYTKIWCYYTTAES